MSSLSRLTGGLSIALGLFVGAFAASRAFGGHAPAGPPPLPLSVALAGAALLFIVLGAGIIGKSRAAWSFGTSLTGVATVAMLLGLPALLRSGIPLWAALGQVAITGVLLSLLIVGRKEIS